METETRLKRICVHRCSSVAKICFSDSVRVRGVFPGAGIIGTWFKNRGIRPAVVWRFVVILALASWWGALTFYGVVVVPAGTEQLGSQTQGLVTQQVTRTLNLIGVALIGLSVRVTC